MAKNYKAWDIDISEYFRKNTAKEKLEFLVGFGVLAPSSHNAQPWKFRVSEGAIDILPDRDRAVPVSDPKEKNLYTALGCALENIVSAADYFGLQPSVMYFPDQEEVAARIEVIFPKHETKELDPGHLIFSIPRRRVNRNKQDPDRQLSAEFIKELYSYSGKGIEVSVVTDGATKKQLAEIVQDSRERIFDKAPFRHEIARYKRNNLTHSSVGITGITMGFNTFMSLFAPTAIKYFNVVRVIGKQERELFGTYSAAHIIISTKKETRQSWMLSGRILERVLLRAEQEGLASAICLLPPITTDLKYLKKLIRTAFHPHIFLRIGYAKDGPPHAPRLSAEEVIVNV